MQSTEGLHQNKIYSGEGLRFGIVTARYHEAIAIALLKGAFDYLSERGVVGIKEFFVPGVFEIPTLLRSLAVSKKFDALIALGCVIKGETAHFDFIAGETTRGIAGVSAEFGLPVGFGLITALTRQQAFERAGGRVGNKGIEAAQVALEMVHRIREI